MKCAEVHSYLLDLATGEVIPAGVQEHLRACQACSTEVESFQKTMALLDEWQAPGDTSPYFMTRLRARVREESRLEAAKSAGWMSWFRKPALAAAFSLLILLSASLILSPGPLLQKAVSTGCYAAENFSCSGFAVSGQE